MKTLNKLTRARKETDKEAIQKLHVSQELLKTYKFKFMLKHYIWSYMLVKELMASALSYHKYYYQHQIMNYLDLDFYY